MLNITETATPVARNILDGVNFIVEKNVGK